MNIYQRPSWAYDNDTESDTENNRLARLGPYADDTESDTENNLLAHHQSRESDAEMLDAARILSGLSVQQPRYNLRASTRAQQRGPTQSRRYTEMPPLRGSTQPLRGATRSLTYDEMSRAEQDAVGGLSAIFDDEAAYQRNPAASRLQPGFGQPSRSFLDADGRLRPTATADMAEYRRDVRSLYETRYPGMTLPPPYDLHPRGRVSPRIPPSGLYDPPL
jgi:hypothetical protein